MFQENIPLSYYSNFKIGGPAKYFFEAKNFNELIIFLESSRAKSQRIFILGGGTNVLFDDKGFDGLVIKPNFQFIKKDKNTLRVGAGVLISELLEFCLENNLGGLEWAGGLPGTLGGAIYGNAGAFGGEIKDIIREVISLDISFSRPEVIKRKARYCNFKYRSSIFKASKNREIILKNNNKRQPSWQNHPGY